MNRPVNKRMNFVSIGPDPKEKRPMKEKRPIYNRQKKESRLD